MNRFFLLSILLITGCTSTRPPVDVTLIPDDCANRHAIIRWLETQSTQNDSAEFQRQVRSRIWRIRYICQPV